MASATPERSATDISDESEYLIHYTDFHTHYGWPWLHHLLRNSAIQDNTAYTGYCRGPFNKDQHGKDTASLSGNR